MSSRLSEMWRVQGIVVSGDGRGKQIGFPTANLLVESLDEQFLQGVYVGVVAWEERGPHVALVNYGNRPTFDGGQLCLEVHVLDFQGDLYDKRLNLTVSHRLRDEQKFDEIEQLVRQIELDIEQARAVLAADPELHKGNHGGKESVDNNRKNEAVSR